MSDDRRKKLQIDADKRDALLALLRYARDELSCVDVAAQYFVEMAILHISEDLQDKRSHSNMYDDFLTIQ